MSAVNPVQIVGPIEAQYGGWCLSCGAAIEVGQKVYWAKGVGTWHIEDEKPRSLAMYTKEAGDRPKGFGR